MLSGMAVAMMLTLGFLECPTDSSGNEILCTCASGEESKPDRPRESAYDAGFCMGYVTGAWTADSLLRTERDLKQIPIGVTSGQVREVFVKYLREHPEVRHGDMFILFTQALREAWPHE